MCQGQSSPKRGCGQHSHEDGILEWVHGGRSNPRNDGATSTRRSHSDQRGVREVGGVEEETQEWDAEWS